MVNDYIVSKGTIVHLCGTSGPLVRLLESSKPHGCPMVEFLNGPRKGETGAATLYLHVLPLKRLKQIAKKSSK